MVAHAKRDERRRRTLCSVTGCCYGVIPSADLLAFVARCTLLGGWMCVCVCVGRLNAGSEMHWQHNRAVKRAQMECMQQADMSGYKTSTLITIKIMAMLYDSAFFWHKMFWSLVGGSVVVVVLWPCRLGIAVCAFVAYNRLSCATLCTLRCFAWPGMCICKLVRMCRREREREEPADTLRDHLLFAYRVSFASIRCTSIDDNTHTRAHRHRTSNVAAPFYL